MNEGWKCPECHTVYAPFVRECKCNKKKTQLYAISVATSDERDNIKFDLFDRTMLVHVEATHKYYKLNSNNYWTEYHPGKKVIVLNVKS